MTENRAAKASKSYVESENSKQDIAIADKASKSYVDSKIAKLPGPQNVLLLDGSKAMTGDLKMGGKNILNVRALSDLKEDDPLETRERDLYSVVNKQYQYNFFKKRL